MTCASSLTEGGQTSTHADDTRALMTVVLLGGISQDDLMVWPQFRGFERLVYFPSFGALRALQALQEPDHYLWRGMYVSYSVCSAFNGVMYYARQYSSSWVLYRISQTCMS